MATTTHTNPVVYDAVETVSRDELATLQLGRLRDVVRRRGIDARIGALDDVRDLPFTTKENLRAHYPLGMMVVSHDRLVRLHSSSGTSGRPTIVGHTFGDLDVWADIMARSLAAAGVGRGTVLHNAYGYGLTTGGFGFQQGAELLGATVVPAAGASTELQMQLLRDLRTQVLCCTPSFAVQIAEAARAGGIDLALEVGIFGGEMWTPGMRHRLEADLGIPALNSYGLSEVIGPGVAQECLVGHDGSHVNEDHFLVEVVDPETGRPVALGELGELVITTLTREAMPLVRYRTGDITSLTVEPCVCGRTTARMAPVVGRRRDELEAAGARFFPSQVETVLVEDPAVALDYQLVVEADRVTVHCEPIDAATDHAELATRLRAAMRDALGTHVVIVVEAPGTEPRTPGKAVRVVDGRGH
jgi:phenylacetate-CoA ligase